MQENTDKATHAEEQKRGIEMLIALGSELSDICLAMKKQDDRTDGERSTLEVLRMLEMLANNTACSILKLSFPLSSKLQDCFSLHRQLNETATNFCYVAASGESVAKEMLMHAHQLTFHRMEQIGKIGNYQMQIKYSAKERFADLDFIKDAVERFTKSNGRRIFEWNTYSLPQRIGSVRDLLGTKISSGLEFSYFMLNEVSSSIIHGTFYGSFYQYGGFLAQSEEERLNQWKDNRALLLDCTLLTYHALLSAFSTKLGLKEKVQEAYKVIETYTPFHKLVI